MEAAADEAVGLSVDRLEIASDMRESAVKMVQMAPEWLKASLLRNYCLVIVGLVNHNH